MGSLLSGWDSEFSDPDLVKIKRNKSLTKEGIEAFWKTKKQKEEEYLKELSLMSPRSKKVILEEAGVEDEASLEKLILKNGWWISSSSAFLNEPPVIAPEGNGHKYAAQFHVAEMAGPPKNRPVSAPQM